MPSRSNETGGNYMRASEGPSLKSYGDGGALSTANLMGETSRKDQAYSSTLQDSYAFPKAGSFVAAPYDADGLPSYDREAKDGPLGADSVIYRSRAVAPPQTWDVDPHLRDGPSISRGGSSRGYNNYTDGRMGYPADGMEKYPTRV